MIEKKQHTANHKDHKLFSYQLNQIFSDADTNSLTADVSFIQDSSSSEFSHIHQNRRDQGKESLTSLSSHDCLHSLIDKEFVLKTSPLFFKRADQISSNDTAVFTEEKSFYLLNGVQSNSTKSKNFKQPRCRCM
jgi:hypothetical protein